MLMRVAHSQLRLHIAFGGGLCLYLNAANGSAWQASFALIVRIQDHFAHVVIGLEECYKC